MALVWQERDGGKACLRALRFAVLLSVSTSLFGLLPVSSIALELWAERTQWLGVQESEPVVVSRSLMPQTALGTVEVLQFEFPCVELTAVVADEGRFTRLSMPEAGISVENGVPALPVFRRHVEVDPFGQYECRARVIDQKGYDLRALELPRLVLPARRAIPKVPGAREAAVLTLDSADYAQWSGPEEVAVLQEAGVINGRRLLLVEVYPVRYHAAEGHIIHRSRIEVKIVRVGTRSTLDTASVGGVATNRLLIIADDSLTDTLEPFVAHKRGRGWMVDMVSTNQTGASRDEIQAHVAARYALDDLRPSHLLLVGDSDTIPVWPGQGAYTPDTDLYYACMDGTDDWLPDMAYGRLPARTPAQLSNMVQKIIYYETTVSSSSTFASNASFAASSDNYSVTEATHNDVIARHMDGRSYTSDKLYSYTYGATKAQVVDAVNSGRGIVTYSGHGYDYKWRDPSFEIADVYSLSNDWATPFVASFACDTGAFSAMDECFSEAWLRADDQAGAVAVLASSEDSYWEEDDVFQKGVYAAIFEDGQRRLGNIVLSAKERQLAYYGPGSETLQYFEQYHLLGDPTLELAVLDGNSSGELAGAVRDLPSGCLNTNELFSVAVEVWVTNPVPSALILKEKLPAGWTVSDAMWNGAPMAPSYASGEYKWLFGVGTPVGSGTLTYNTRADGQTGEVHTFSGVLLCGSSTITTLGDQEVRICSEIDSDGDGIPDYWESLYGMNTTNAADAMQHWDADSLNNLQEYLGDTNPTNADSALAIIGLTVSNGAVRTCWRGGTHAVQYLEHTTNLLGTSAWFCCHIAIPPTPITNSWDDTCSEGVSNRFYRLRATR